MAKRRPEIEPPLNRNEVLERVGGEEAFLEELLDLYHEEFASKAEAMNRSLASADFPRLRDLGHALKGASANLSLPGLRAASASMEAAGRDGDAAGARKALTDLHREYDRLREFLEIA